jgi:uncharacterized membrane protein YedE/YeeE
MDELAYGLITGAMFGFLLQKARVLRYDRQIGALRFKDATIIKFMLTNVITGMIGVYILLDFGLVQLSVKPTILGGIILGGLLFGVGWGMLGYCPGTSLGALGEGRWDAIWGIGGMLAGAALYAEVFPTMKTTVLTWGNYGKITLPQLLGVNHWVIIILFVIGVVGLFYWLEHRARSNSASSRNNYPS